MSDADLPEAPDQGELEKKGLLSRSVGGYKQAQARAADKQAQQVRALDDRFKADEEARRAQRHALLDQATNYSSTAWSRSDRRSSATR
jgi:hypothetical protein